MGPNPGDFGHRPAGTQGERQGTVKAEIGVCFSEPRDPRVA